ncbi:TPA: hypothetical protein PDS25_002740 [Staphylococcus aureus]|nr:hypothetical protein [Staphylococcus aureus]HDB3402366.1 hypothetical protein [Staphylococcus aureus]HDE6601621.1 hypothetical protein [Staphylococcus aureus]
MEFFTYKQDDIEEYSKKLILESKRYKGRMPKKKRIRNKIQKKREKERLRKFYSDEFHLVGVNNKIQPILAPKEIDHKDMQIIGTSGKGQEQHYDKNGNRLY